MTKRTVADLMAIAQFGGGFEIDGSDYSPTDLMTIAGNLCNGATMRVRNVYKYSTDDLARIAQHGPPGAVQFVFVL